MTLATFTEAENADTGHTLYTYPLDGFANGETHTLLFAYLGPTTGFGSFSLDDVSVDVTACLPNLFADRFESGTTAAWSPSIP